MATQPRWCSVLISALVLLGLLAGMVSPVFASSESKLLPTVTIAPGQTMFRWQAELGKYSIGHVALNEAGTKAYLYSGGAYFGEMSLSEGSTFNFLDGVFTKKGKNLVFTFSPRPGSISGCSVFPSAEQDK